jgi:hypothetical protein
MMDNVLDQIRILNVESVLPFDWPETTEGVGADDDDSHRLIRDPFPVIRIQNGDQLLLENAGLFRALISSGIGQVPVQIYPAEAVKIVADTVALVGFGYADLVRLAARYPDQFIVREYPDDPPVGFVPARFDLPGSDRIFLHLRHSSRTGCPHSLDYLFRAITSKGSYLPVVEYGDSSEPIVKVAKATAYLTPPAFSLEDLTAAAVSDRLFPPNVFRPLAGYKVINVDFPLSVLRSDMPPGDKESFLRELIRFRAQSRKTAFVEGRVYILNR